MRRFLAAAVAVAAVLAGTPAVSQAGTTAAPARKVVLDPMASVNLFTGRIRATGRVSPAPPDGTTVYLQRYQGGKWTSLASGRTSKGAATVLATQPASIVRGWYRMTVVSTGGYSTGASATRTLMTYVWRKSFGIDFDKDYRTDPTVWRPGTGTFWSLTSQDGTVVKRQWGQLGDVPIIEDIDKNYGPDYIARRPSNATFYQLNSGGGAVATAWGTANDLPLIGELGINPSRNRIAIARASSARPQLVYRAESGAAATITTGDDKTNYVPLVGRFGRSAFATWSTGFGRTSGAPVSAPQWHIRKDDGTEIHKRFGTWGDRPLLADFDGDNVDDLTVWRPSTGTWYILRSTDGKTLTRRLGADGDVPMALYAGDMTFSTAVWRPSNGTFYIVPGKGGPMRTVKWGQAGDIPL